MDQKFLALQGRNIAVYSMLHDGQRPIVLFGPGMTRDRNFEFYPRVLDELYRAGYNVFFVDPTGFGQSQEYTPPVTVETHIGDIDGARKEAAKYGGVHLVAHSYSCAVGSPVNGFVSRVYLGPVFRARKHFSPLMEEGSIERKDGLVTIRRNGARIVTTPREIRRALDMDFSTYAPSIDCPTTVIDAEQDDLNTAEEVAAFMKGLRTRKDRRVIAGADHNFKGYEDQVAREVLDWLDDITDRQTYA